MLIKGNCLLGQEVDALLAAYGAECERRGREDALRNLASGMKKVLSPEELKIVKYACSPLEAFLEDLRK